VSKAQIANLSCLQKYQHLFDVNAKHSFYLQSKVHRAREAIEAAVKEEAERPR